MDNIAKGSFLASCFYDLFQNSIGIGVFMKMELHYKWFSRCFQKFWCSYFKTSEWKDLWSMFGRVLGLRVMGFDYKVIPQALIS